MEKDFLEEFIEKANEENEVRFAQEKRKKYFEELGRKGGLKKKTEKQLSKIISCRLSEIEYNESQKKADEYSLKLSAYARMIYLQQELKVNEFENDKTLLKYGNNFLRISNLLRNREWNIFDNKKQILEEIKEVLDLIRQYLYLKKDEKNKE